MADVETPSAPPVDAEALKRLAAVLPAWAAVDGEGVVHIDDDQAYPAWLALLEVTELDQYWHEVAYQCSKLDVQLAARGARFLPASGTLVIKRRSVIRDDGRSAWDIKRFPVGRGWEAAAKGREAREHFRRIRGFLP